MPRVYVAGDEQTAQTPVVDIVRDEIEDYLKERALRLDVTQVVKSGDQRAGMTQVKDKQRQQR